MALVRIPFIGLIFRPFVKQEISRECLLGLLGQINPEKNFDGELMVFGAMSTRDIQARYDFLIKGGYKGPSSGCLLYTSPSPRDRTRSRMPSSA